MTRKTFERGEAVRFEPECPGPDCPMCNGAACNKCGAGCWNNSAPHCEHASDERHDEPDYTTLRRADHLVTLRVK